MVLVGEPTKSFESAAFTFLLPGGCCYDPKNRAGLASLTGEMMLRSSERKLLGNFQRLLVSRAA